LLSLSGQACGQSIEANEEQSTKVATVEAVAPQSAPMTLEEIRAEQKVLEAEIEKIKAKGELERADKIDLLILKRRYNAVLTIKVELQEEVIQQQKQKLAEEFASARKQIQK